MKTYTMNLITISVIMFSFLNQAHVSVNELPKVDMRVAMNHQKELVGSKRSPQSMLESTHESSIATKVVHALVLENLPKKHKKQARRLTATIIEESKKYGFDPLFLVSVMRHESSFNPDALGGVGEIGLMQIRPTTAEWLNKKHKIVKKINLKDPVINVKIGAFYLSQLRESFDQNSRWYISAYNMGPANVKKNLAKNVKPKEYVNHVMKYYLEYIAVLNTEYTKQQGSETITVAGLE